VYGAGELLFVTLGNQQHSRFPQELYSVVTVLLVAFQWSHAVVPVGVLQCLHLCPNGKELCDGGGLSPVGHPTPTGTGIR